jgi:hypothetical protein
MAVVPAVCFLVVSLGLLTVVALGSLTIKLQFNVDGDVAKELLSMAWLYSRSCPPPGLAGRMRSEVLLIGLFRIVGMLMVQ